MAASDIEICNIALALVGEPAITAFNDASEAERQCERLYPLARDTVLRLHPWNFAEKQSQLDLSLTVPDFEFGHYFDLPADYIRVLNVVEATSPYRVVNGTFIATDDSAVNLVYTAKITDTTKFDPLFTQALAYYLASQLCMILPNKASLNGQFMQLFDNIVKMAKQVDGQENSSQKLNYKDSWMSYRRGSRYISRLFQP